MRQLPRVAVIVAVNSLITLTLLAYFAGRHQILHIRFSSPILRCNVSIDDTGLIATRHHPRRTISFSTVSQPARPQRWDRLFNSSGHGWANPAFAYHDAYMGQSGATIIGTPRYGVTHHFLLLLSGILTVLLYRAPVTKILRVLRVFVARTYKSAHRRTSFPKIAG